MINYLEVIKNNKPNCESFWEGKILRGKIIYDKFTIEYEIDCSDLDFCNLDNCISEIQCKTIQYDFVQLGKLSKEETKDLKNALSPHVPYFTELAIKELEKEQENSMILSVP